VSDLRNKGQRIWRIRPHAPVNRRALRSAVDPAALGRPPPARDLPLLALLALLPPHLLTLLLPHLRYRMRNAHRLCVEKGLCDVAVITRHEVKTRGTLLLHTLLLPPQLQAADAAPPRQAPVGNAAPVEDRLRRGAARGAAGASAADARAAQQSLA